MTKCKQYKHKNQWCCVVQNIKLFCTQTNFINKIILIILID